MRFFRLFTPSIFLPFQNFYENILDQKSKYFFSFILPKFILQQTFFVTFSWKLFKEFI
jgi:hypothetical protein